MTAYWDDLRRQVREISNLPDDQFVAAVVDIETRVMRDVSLTTGDREFPDDLRDKIQGVIACNAVDHGPFIYGQSSPPGDMLINERAKAWLLLMRYSVMLEELHALFHVVAARKPPNRYNHHFTDDPTSFLRAREAMLE